MKPMTVDEALAHAKIHAVPGGAQYVLANEVRRQQGELTIARDELQSWIDSRNGWMERAHDAEDTLKEWRETMQEAHDTFQRYADLHQAKGTPDGHEKAKANQKLANKLFALLQPAPAAPAPDLSADLILCKGSIALGTGCGKCASCNVEIVQIYERGESIPEKYKHAEPDRFSAKDSGV